MRAVLARLLSTFMLIFAAEATAHASVITFNTDPFAGSTALSTPGRQIVGNELFTVFDVSTDVFAFDASVFGVNQILFANDVAANLPTSNVNVVVLQSFDNDNNPATPFGAGTAANLIAAQLLTPGPGFFIYFNQGLDLPRLVFSTDLSDPTADLKVLARLTNLTGQAGRDAFPLFTAGNFAITQVPEPALTLLLVTSAGIFGARRWNRRLTSSGR